MQSAGSRTFQKYFTSKEQDNNFTSLKLIGYSARVFQEETKFETKKHLENQTPKTLVWRF